MSQPPDSPPIHADFDLDRLVEEVAANQQGLAAAAEPFRRFMAAQVRDADLALLLDLANIPPTPAEQAPWRALMPASWWGNCGAPRDRIPALPALPGDRSRRGERPDVARHDDAAPTVVALPFKLAFFVLVDGWRLVSGGLVQGFAT